MAAALAAAWANWPHAVMAGEAATVDAASLAKVSSLGMQKPPFVSLAKSSISISASQR